MASENRDISVAGVKMERGAPWQRMIAGSHRLCLSQLANTLAGRYIALLEFELQKYDSFQAWGQKKAGARGSDAGARG